MGIPLRVLMVEDSEDDAALLVLELQHGGYEVQSERVDNMDALLAALGRHPWDLVIADYSMPHFRGTDALAIVRKRGLDLPFIFVSGTIGEETAVAAMRGGAQDYIMKGNLRRLVPAIEREMREVEVRRERTRSAEALRRAERRFHELVEHATYGIYWSTAEGKFLDVNPALVAMLGYNKKEEVLALDMARDLYTSPDERQRVIAMPEGEQGLWEVEVQWKQRDGKHIRVRLSGRTLRDEQGRPESFEVIAEDVTQRRALEKQVAMLQRFEAIGRLAGGIAHDFNNVLGAIMGWANLAETTTGAKQQKYLAKVTEQVQRATGLTQQLLAFARQQVLEPRNIDLNQVVTSTLALLTRLIGKDVEVSSQLAPELSVVRVDPTQIEQVIMNLCLNARDAMPRGGRLLLQTEDVHMDEDYARRYPYVNPGSYVCLTVSDTGEGMDAATLEHMFEPFFTTKEMGRGTGLGLATVYGIVKQHGGFIHAYSEPGHGSTFRIYLPAGAGAAEKQARARRRKPARGGNETILIAEDNEDLRDLAKEILEPLGYRVLVAGNGEEALRVFEEHRDQIALVILDVIMPKLGGPEACESMRRLKPGIPAIFTTGYSKEMTLLNAMLKEEAAILQKPYDARILAEKIRELLDPD